MSSRSPAVLAAGRTAFADATDAAAMQKALDGIEVAYYVVHSLGSSDFEERDRVAAATPPSPPAEGSFCPQARDSKATKAAADRSSWLPLPPVSRKTATQAC
jgi:hypothetical protein